MEITEKDKEKEEEVILGFKYLGSLHDTGSLQSLIRLTHLISLLYVSLYR